jgi:RimJ/RimL family protein N-acetyltransferase
MAGTGTVWVGVRPEAAYRAVSDLPRMGGWSPENRGGEWVEPARGPVVGATFRGRNENASGAFETIATVVEAEPPTSFAFCVAPPGEAGTTWRYTFRASGIGTTVTEAFEWFWTPLAEGFRGRVGRMPIAEAAVAVRERGRHLQDQVDRTLEALRRVLERDWLPIGDGDVTLRPPTDDDRAAFLAGRDAEWRRWLGPGNDDPRPTAAVVVEGQVVGWVDFDVDRQWLEPGEVNVGYTVFPQYRQRGYASRAVTLLLRHLVERTSAHTATLAIHPDNVASLGVAARAGFAPAPTDRSDVYLKRRLDS